MRRRSGGWNPWGCSPADDLVQLELVALDIEDVSEDDEGLLLVLRRSKTDQEAAWMLERQLQRGEKAAGRRR